MGKCAPVVRRRLRHSILLGASVAVAVPAIAATDVIAAEVSPVVEQFDLISPAPGNEAFGRTVLVLTNGNYVVHDPEHDSGATADVGAVFLYDGDTDTVVSALTGSQAFDLIGSGGIFEVGDSDFVIVSPQWSNGIENSAGAVTFARGDTGVNGVVSTTNSLHGTSANDRVGFGGVTVLANGNYVVASPDWDSGTATDAGAVTWGNGTVGRVGAVTIGNSLHGTAASDRVGTGGITALTNGNYVVNSPFWSDGADSSVGAATWGNGTTGTTGPVTTTNSLHGVTTDVIGDDGVTALSNGNYVVASASWNNGTESSAGAVTWGNGATGITGPVTTANSLHGTQDGDEVGSSGVTALTNGNYVVISQRWANGANDNAGAATWGNGETGITGPVSTANSLHGTTASDGVGSGGVTALTNGNYVVGSLSWRNDTAGDAGAATWGNGTTGITGPVTTANSLHGTQSGDRVALNRVTALANGNYVVASGEWQNGATSNAGAATWGDGTIGITGPVTTSNSLHGTDLNDKVGIGRVTALANGNYVVASTSWNNGGTTNVGAATWANGATGITGPVTTANSLHGTQATDQIALDGITALTGGNYVVTSRFWNNGVISDAGAATWGNGTTGITGPVSTANSLHGTQADDEVGSSLFGGGVTALAGDNYVVASANWNNGATTDAGAVTLGSGVAGTVGPVTSSNSVIGTPPGAVRRPGPDVTSNDALVVPTTQDRVLLMRLDLAPRFDTAPADVTAATAPGETTTIVDYPLPIATDLRDTTPPTVTCTPASGTAFPIGDTTVTCSATDSKGSTSTTSFVVTVTATAEIDDITSITPTRLLDTRPGETTIDDLFAGDGLVAAGTELEVQIAGRGTIPTDAASVVLNVVAINPGQRGFLTIHACDDRPNAASLNYAAAGDVIGNEIITELSATGTICIYTSATTHLTADATAYAPPTSRINSITPTRLLDTRPGEQTIDDLFAGDGLVPAGTELEIQIAGRDTIPTDAASVVMNVVAINPDQRGFLTIHACDDRPNAASLNYASAGDVIGNEIITKLSPAGTICIYTSTTTHLTADATAWLPTGTDITTITPTRLLDTRPGQTTIDTLFAGNGLVPADTELEIQITGRPGIPTDAASVVLNVVAINPGQRGFLTIHACDERPNAASLNYASAGDVIGNEIITELSATGTICIYTSATTHLTADATAYIPT